MAAGKLSAVSGGRKGSHLPDSDAGEIKDGGGPIARHRVPASHAVILDVLNESRRTSARQKLCVFT